MATTRKEKTHSVAEVDALVDENGSRIDVPQDSDLKVAGEHDETVGATGPTNWFLYGLIGLAIIVAVILLMQLLTGAPGTAVQPGSPVSAPVTEPAVPAS
tara:strand:- start:541 stop:840 length:300 start_codon:yes stop_codon:yes gene_type:complete